LYEFDKIHLSHTLVPKEWEKIDKLLKTAFINTIFSPIHKYRYIGFHRKLPIVSDRGLRHDDPISPYLFIICVEGLSSLIHEVEHRNDIRGTMICTGVPVISHLLFVDDCFLFFRAYEREAVVMENILVFYEEALGQAINLQKSELFFS